MARIDATNFRPKYRKQKANKRGGIARAFVEINGQRTYLGDFGTPHSKQAYDRIVAEWLANGRNVPIHQQPADTVITVAVIVAEYLKWAQTKYRKPDGSLSTRFQDTRDAVRPLIALYADTPAADFGPNKLKTVRSAMVEGKTLCRKTVNERIGIIKRVFAKAVEFELLEAAVADKLEYVEGMSAGEAEVRESKVVTPADEKLVDAVRPHVSRQVEAVIDLQLMTGARPGELLGPAPVRPEHEQPGHVDGNLDAAQDCAPRPDAHSVLLCRCAGGPKRVHHRPPYRLPDVLAPRSGARAAGEAARRSQDAAVMRQPSWHQPQRQPEAISRRHLHRGDRRAIVRACDVAWPHPDLSKTSPEELTPEQNQEFKTWRAAHRWHPYQLRHNAATRFKQTHGWEITQMLLGHSAESSITAAYVENDRVLIEQIAQKIQAQAQTDNTVQERKAG